MSTIDIIKYRIVSYNQFIIIRVMLIRIFCEDFFSRIALEDIGLPR